MFSEVRQQSLALQSSAFTTRRKKNAQHTGKEHMMKEKIHHQSIFQQMKAYSHYKLAVVVGTLIALIVFAVFNSVFVVRSVVNMKRNPKIIHLRMHHIDTQTHPDIVIHNEQPATGATLLTTSVFNWFFSSASKLEPTLQMTTFTSEEKERVKSWLVHLDHELHHVEKFEKDDLQFEQIIQRIGMKLGQYVPHNSYLVSGTFNQLSQLKKEVGHIKWTGEFHPEHKSPSSDIVRNHLERQVDVTQLQRLKEQKIQSQAILHQFDKYEDKVEFVLQAHCASHDSADHLKQELVADLNSKKDEVEGIISIVAASKKKIGVGVKGARNAYKVAKWLADHGLVHWVEVKPQTIVHNKFGAMLAQSYETPFEKPLWKRGLHGEGQVIGVGDTGVDHYHCFFYDEKNAIPFQRNLKENVPESKHRKFAGFWKYMDSVDSPGGHGTHVTGTASGHANEAFSSPTLQQYSSLAYASKLAFGDSGCDSDEGCSCPDDVQCECDLKPDQLCDPQFGVVYLPLDLSDGYFPWYYSKGARVVSSSWGTGYFRDFSFGYSTSSAEIDDFVFNHPDLLPVFAGGNSGGEYGYASLTTESEAKNALIIGATQNMLESFKEATNFTDYSQIVDSIRMELYQTYCMGQGDRTKCQLAKEFSADKCCGDNEAHKCEKITDKCCGTQAFPEFKSAVGFRCCPQCISFELESTPEHFSPNNIASFTARGPTLDGRVKPDLVTAGDKVLSANSMGTIPQLKCSANQDIKTQLLKHEGTSMAAPLAAASAIIVRQFYEQGYLSGKKNENVGFKPSAALVKATLIHSTRLLNGMIYLSSKRMWWPLQYKSGHRFELKLPYFQGYGAIDLNSALGEDANLYVPNKVDRTLKTAEQHVYCIKVEKTDKPFKVTLVWSDAASSPVAKLNLVNDLDLIIIDPDGKRHFGNGPNSPVQTALEEADYLNNVEQLVFNAPMTGRYTVIILGANVPKGPQPYAIVISGSISVTSGCSKYSAATFIDSKAQIETYTTLSYVFGVTSLILIPALAILSLYLFLQYRSLTTEKHGYRRTNLADADRGSQMLQPQRQSEMNEYF